MAFPEALLVAPAARAEENGNQQLSLSRGWLGGLWVALMRTESVTWALAGWWQLTRKPCLSVLCGIFLRTCLRTVTWRRLATKWQLFQGQLFMNISPRAKELAYCVLSRIILSSFLLHTLHFVLSNTTQCFSPTGMSAFPGFMGKT